MDRKHLRDLDVTIVNILIVSLEAFYEMEDNSMEIKDRKKIFPLINLLKEYRDGYGEVYLEVKGNVEKWNENKKVKYNKMFKLLKALLPKLII